MIFIWLFNNRDNNHMGENGDNINNSIAMFMFFFFSDCFVFHNIIPPFLL